MSAYNFQCLKQEEIEEKGRGCLYRHTRTNAHLFYFDKKCENISVLISFKTIPYNNTGVFHVLEHSTFRGSLHYPDPDIFARLNQESFNTYLNAKTMADKTIYLGCSRDQYELLQIVKVMLDGIFFPAFYNNPAILFQERGDYKFNPDLKKTVFSGIVYNEMLGLSAYPDFILPLFSSRSLFPDTSYKYNYAGEPGGIPDLTQDELVNAHKTFYNPANCFIIVHGKCRIEIFQKFFNAVFQKKGNPASLTDIHFQHQLPFCEPATEKYEYPVPVKSKHHNKYICLNFALPDTLPPYVVLAFPLLLFLLLKMPMSPLKKFILDRGLAQDVKGSFEPGLPQPVFSIILKQPRIDNPGVMYKAIHEWLGEFILTGIDNNIVKTALNKGLLSIIESNHDFRVEGIGDCYHILNGWFFKADPAVYLKSESHLEKIGSLADPSAYFADLIRKYILKNNHCSAVLLIPGELNNITEGNRNGFAASVIQVPESSPTKAAAPKRTLISRGIGSFRRLIKKVSQTDAGKYFTRNIGNIPVLFNENKENDILYANFYFDASPAMQYALSYTALLTLVLRNRSMDSHGHSSLLQNIYQYTGGIRFDLKIYPDFRIALRCANKFVLSSRVLSGNGCRLLELIDQIIQYGCGIDKEYLVNTIKIYKRKMEEKIFEQSSAFAINRLLSYFSLPGLYNEAFGGLTFYNFLSDLLINIDGKIEAITAALKELYDCIFARNNLVVSVYGPARELPEFFNRLSCFMVRKEVKNPANQCAFSEPEIYNEGLILPIKTLHVVKGYNLKALGHTYSGDLHVLKLLIRYRYLWEFIRNRGDAYSCSATVTRNGDIFFSTLNAGNITHIMEAFDRIPEFIDTLSLKKYELNNLMMGAINNLYPYIPRSVQNEYYANCYFSQITPDFRERELNEIIRLDAKKIKGFKNLIRDVLNRNFFCVLGNDEIINRNKSLFKKIINIIK